MGWDGMGWDEMRCGRVSRDGQRWDQQLDKNSQHGGGTRDRERKRKKGREKKGWGEMRSDGMG